MKIRHCDEPLVAAPGHRPRAARQGALWVATAALLTGCAAAPELRPPAPREVPAAYKEAPRGEAGWFPVVPADALERDAWWQRFGDPALDALAPQVAVSNQNVAAAAAAYVQARALVGEQRAALLPQVGAEASAARTRTGSRVNSDAGAGVRASWVPDLWGRIGRAVAGAQARAEASAADLAGATLAAQGELATDLVLLRDADHELELLRRTVAAFERSRAIAQNRYEAGIAARTDVFQAQSQLASTRADLTALAGRRAQLEHAIAVLVGRAPGNFAVLAADWNRAVPPVPLGVPSALLQRRPDIASAARAVEAAEAQIGVQRAAWYPSITLTGSAGPGSARLADLFSAPTLLWSLGVSVAQTVFDGGAIRARIAGAEAAREQAVAVYRQTVLLAFQAVEDQLASARALAEQAGLRAEASDAADRVEQQILNRYRAGQVNFTEVVTAQAAALAARRTVAQLAVNRQTAAIGLIQALGGGWSEP